MKIASEKKLVDKFADILQQIYQLIIFYTYIEESDGDEMIHNDTLNDYGTIIQLYYTMIIQFLCNIQSNISHKYNKHKH